MSTWNKKNFSIYTSDERSALGLIEELGNITNQNSTEIDNINNKISELDEREIIENKKKLSIEEYQKDITQVRKIDNTGNFTGSWFGIARPEQAEPGISNQVKENRENIEFMKLYKTKASELTALVLQKLRKQEQMTFIFQGDSMTYGQDTISSDKRVADPLPCDDGSYHVHNRAGVTYPEAMKLYLDEIYPNASHIVINKGYSGDWVEQGFNRWNKNSNAHISFIMYGSNDADLNASWVPSNVKGNITKFITDYRKLIERYLSWGTLPVLLTPPKQSQQENGVNGRIAESYRNSLFVLGNEYNIPVIDTEELSNGWNNTFYADGTHFNTKGYKAFASRLLSFLIGGALVNNVDLHSNENLGVRTTRDNIFTYNCGFDYTSGSVGAEEGGINVGMALLPSGGHAVYSFNCLEDNMILIPIYGTWSSQKLKVTLDFNTEQSSGPISNLLNDKPKFYKPSSQLICKGSSYAVMQPNIVSTAYKNNDFIHITNKGYHNIKVEQVEKSTMGVALNGFIVLSYNDFMSLTENKASFIHLLTHDSWSSSPSSVSEIEISCSDLSSVFNNKLSSNEYYKRIPMKVVLTNSSQTLIESSFMWHDNGIDDVKPDDGFASKFYHNVINLQDSPTNFRTIEDITYDGVNRKYIIKFGGNLTQLSSITIKPL